MGKENSQSKSEGTKSPAAIFVWNLLGWGFVFGALSVFALLMTEGDRVTWGSLFHELGTVARYTIPGFVIGLLFAAVFYTVRAMTNVNFKLALGWRKLGLAFVILMAAVFFMGTNIGTVHILESRIFPTPTSTPTPSPTSTPTSTNTPTPTTEESLILDVLANFEELAIERDYYSIYYHLHTYDFRIRNRTLSGFESTWNYSSLTFTHRHAQLKTDDSLLAQVYFRSNGRRSNLEMDTRERSFCMDKTSGEWLINKLNEGWDEKCWDD